MPRESLGLGSLPRTPPDPPASQAPPDQPHPLAHPPACHGRHFSPFPPPSRPYASTAQRDIFAPTHDPSPLAPPRPRAPPTPAPPLRHSTRMPDRPPRRPLPARTTTRPLARLSACHPTYPPPPARPPQSRFLLADPSTHHISKSRTDPSMCGGTGWSPAAPFPFKSLISDTSFSQVSTLLARCRVGARYLVLSARSPPPSTQQEETSQSTTYGGITGSNQKPAMMTRTTAPVQKLVNSKLGSKAARCQGSQIFSPSVLSRSETQKMTSVFLSISFCSQFSVSCVKATR